MKRSKIHYAERGNISAQGASKSEAKANLESLISWYCAQPGPVIESRFGFTLVIVPIPTGWQIDVFDAAELQHGARRHSCSHIGQVSLSDALDSARSHAAQNAWPADIPDDSAFVETAGLPVGKAGDLARWIRFQRSYLKFKAAGHTPNDCHRMACDSSYQESRQ